MFFSLSLFSRDTLLSLYMPSPPANVIDVNMTRVSRMTQLENQCQRRKSDGRRKTGRSSHFSSLSDRMIIHPPASYIWTCSLLTRETGILCITVPSDHLVLDSAPNLGPLISRWEINKFKNCWYKSVRILEEAFVSAIFEFVKVPIMSGPILGDLAVQYSVIGGTFIARFVSARKIHSSWALIASHELYTWM